MATTSHDSETPAQNQQVITACAFITHDFDGVRKVFLPRRAETKKFLPGVYELPGGHIDFGEHIVDGLKREVMEELGVRIEVGEPFYVHDYTNEIKGSHSVEIVYFATLLDPIESIVRNPEDHAAHEWLTKEEVKTIVAENREASRDVAAIMGEEGIDHELEAMLRGFERAC